MENVSNIYHFVIAFVGPLGSGCTTSYDLMREVLAEEKLHKGSYELVQIKVSDILKENDSVKEDYDNFDAYQKTRHLQKIGNELRRIDQYKVGKLIVEKLIAKRIKIKFDSTGSDIFVFSIIDSLKNPYDLKFLKNVYGRSLMLIGVTADRDVRWTRLKKKSGWGGKEQQFNEIDEIDREERDEQGNAILFGQKVEDVFMSADYYIVNNEGVGHNLTTLKQELGRAVQILTRNLFISPTKNETFMHYAWAASRRSLCMSRQVGAAIVSKTGALLSLGWNEVPRAGGGLYAECGHAGNDARCAGYGDEPICFNDQQKGIIVDELFSKLVKEYPNIKENEKVLRSIFRKSRISDLIEFSRAVHAEMEAIIAVARNASMGLRDSTLYVTTMPCHSCARHIVASGIKEVQYIEPYRKSKAVALHSDSINLSNKEIEGKVWFRQYGGIAPSNYLEAYEAHHERKQESGSKASEFHASYLDKNYSVENHNGVWYTNGELVNLISSPSKEEASK